MHGHRGHVRSRGHGGDRHILPEVEVRAVGLIGQTVHSRLVGHLYNGAQIGADAVVSGVIHQYGHRVGMFLNGLGHLLPLHAQGNTQPVVYLRVHVHGNGAAQNQGVDDAAVDVSGHDDLVPTLAHRQHHGLHRAGGASYHQKSVGRPKGVSCQLLRLSDVY